METGRRILSAAIPILFPDVQIPIDKIPAQKGTDLQYIRQLANDVGRPAVIGVRM